MRRVTNLSFVICRLRWRSRTTQISVMTIEVFRIVLGRVVQHPGQMINGKVELWNKSKITSKGIHLIIKGEANCKWTELRPKEDMSEKHTIVFFTGNETYVDDRLVVLAVKGKGPFVKHRAVVNTTYLLWRKGGESLTIPPGKHEYPFEFLLPRHLPSSFESGSYGNVRYVMKAVLQRNWRPDNHCEVPLHVNTIIDLNTIPTATVKFSYFKSWLLITCLYILLNQRKNNNR